MSLPSAISISFNRRLRAAWLTEGLRLLADDVDRGLWVERMTEMVGAENKGHDTIKKSVRYLRQIWIEPGQSHDLREQAIKLYSNSKDKNRERVISWGMVVATYPFINDVAAAIGRILKAQNELKMEQLVRRLSEAYGERETVRRSIRYSLSLIHDLGLLTRTGARGVYQAAPPITITDTKLSAWLVRAWFVASGDSEAVDRVSLSGHPSLFFCDSKKIVNDALANGALALERLSITQETVRLIAVDQID